MTEETHGRNVGEVNTFVEAFPGGLPTGPEQLLHVGSKTEISVCFEEGKF